LGQRASAISKKRGTLPAACKIKQAAGDGGRPTSCSPEYVAQAEKLCRFGATDAQLADFFDVSITTACSRCPSGRRAGPSKGVMTMNFTFDGMPQKL
jgi:hypothetical protein